MPNIRQANPSGVALSGLPALVVGRYHPAVALPAQARKRSVSKIQGWIVRAPLEAGVPIWVRSSKSAKKSEINKAEI